jgi:hypothetical protein
MTPRQYAASPPCPLIPAESPCSGAGPCGGGSASNGVSLTWFEALKMPRSYSMRNTIPLTPRLFPLLLRSKLAPRGLCPVEIEGRRYAPLTWLPPALGPYHRGGPSYGPPTQTA